MGGQQAPEEVDKGAFGWPAITAQAKVVGGGAEKFGGSVAARMGKAAPFEEVVDGGIGVHEAGIYLDQRVVDSRLLPKAKLWITISNRHFDLDEYIFMPL